MNEAIHGPSQDEQPAYSPDHAGFNMLREKLGLPRIPETQVDAIASTPLGEAAQALLDKHIGGGAEQTADAPAGEVPALPRERHEPPQGAVADRVGTDEGQSQPGRLAVKFKPLAQAKKEALERGGQQPLMDGGSNAAVTLLAGADSAPDTAAQPVLVGPRIRNEDTLALSAEERRRVADASAAMNRRAAELRPEIEENRQAVIARVRRVLQANGAVKEAAGEAVATGAEPVAADAAPALPQRRPERRPTPAAETPDEVRRRYAAVLAGRVLSPAAVGEGWDPTLVSRYLPRGSDHTRSDRARAPAGTPGQNPAERTPAAAEFPVVAGFSRGSRRGDSQLAGVRHFLSPSSGRHGRNAGRHRRNPRAEF